VGDIRTTFGRRVRELRNGLGISQEELADRAGLHYTYVGGIERGERNLGVVNVEKMAGALGVSLAEFFAPFSARPVSKRHRAR
jgi:transcriptional regulator with XRE-family HTH domain